MYARAQQRKGDELVTFENDQLCRNICAVTGNHKNEKREEEVQKRKKDQAK